MAADLPVAISCVHRAPARAFQNFKIWYCSGAMHPKSLPKGMSESVWGTAVKAHFEEVIRADRQVAESWCLICLC